MSLSIPGVVGPDTPTLNVGETVSERLGGSPNSSVDTDLFRLNLTPGQGFLLQVDALKTLSDVDVVDADGNIVIRPTWSYANGVQTASFWMAPEDPIAELFLRTEQTNWARPAEYQARLLHLSAQSGTDGDDLLTVRLDDQAIFGGTGIDTLSLQGLSNPFLRLDRSELKHTDALGDEVTIRVHSIERFVGTEGDDELYGSSFLSRFDIGVPHVSAASTIPDVSWFGGGGDDLLGDTQGVTLFDGGLGNDTADYSGLASIQGAVNASLLRGRTFGEGAGKGDSFVSIENLIGSVKNDTLTGDHGDNVLHGYLGRDVLIGLGGDDTLSSSYVEKYGEFPPIDRAVARYSGPRADYTITKKMSEDGVMLLEVAHLDGAGWEGRDTLRNIPILEFADGQIEVDTLPDDHGDGVTTPATRVSVGERIAVLGDTPRRGDQNDVDRIEVELVAGQQYLFRLERSASQFEPIEPFFERAFIDSNSDIDLKITAPDGTPVFSQGHLDNTISTYGSGTGTYPLIDTAAYKPVIFTAQQSGVFSFDITTVEHKGPVTGSWFKIVEVEADNLGTQGDDELTWDASDTLVDGGDGTDQYSVPLDDGRFSLVTPGLDGDLLLYASKLSARFNNILERASFTTLRNVETLILGDGYDNVDLRYPTTLEAAFSPAYQSTLRFLDGGEGKDTFQVGSRPPLDVNRGVWKTWEKPDGVLVDLASEQATGGITLRNFERVIGSAGDDTLIGNDEGNHLDGFAGNNEIRGGDGDDLIRSGYDASVIHPGAGSDQIFATPGSEIVFSDNVADSVLHLLGANNNPKVAVRAQDGSSNLIEFANATGAPESVMLTFADTSYDLWYRGTVDTGQLGNDIMFATQGVTELTGGQGDDLLFSDRRVHFGDSTPDTAIYRYRLSDYRIEFSTSEFGFDQGRKALFETFVQPALLVDYVGRWAGDGNDQIAGFSKLQFYDRTLDVHYGLDTPVFVGNGAADIFIGHGHRNTQSDFNTATGRGGNDTMDGGTGLFDRAIYRGQREDFDIDMHEGRIIVADQVAGRDGTDVLTRFDLLVFTDQTVEVSHLGEDDDDFVGSLGDDIVMATAGDDRVRGKHGDDTIDGGAGDDTAVYSYIRQQYEVRTEDGRIIVDYTGPWFGDGTDVVTDFETLEFFNTSMPVVQGGAEADSMFGTWRSEVFLGAEGNDRFRGGYGDDVIDGGAGMDTALYRYRYADYSIRRLDGGDLEVAYTGRWHGDGTDRLAGVEQLEFVDRTIMVDDLVF